MLVVFGECDDDYWRVVLWLWYHRSGYICAAALRGKSMAGLGQQRWRIMPEEWVVMYPTS